MRRSLLEAAVALLLAVVAGSGLAHATAFNPMTVDDCPGAAALSPGVTVFLFHGGAKARESIRTGDVLAVQRPRLDGHWHAVGKVRVDAEAGALCFRAEVVEGELQQHDVAPEGGGAFLVITSDAPCRFEPRR